MKILVTEQHQDLIVAINHCRAITNMKTYRNDSALLEINTYCEALDYPKFTSIFDWFYRIKKIDSKS